jgi:hypothetical protein
MVFASLLKTGEPCSCYSKSGNTAATTITTTSPRLIDEDSDVQVPVQHSNIDKVREICCCLRGHVPRLKSGLSAELRKIVVLGHKKLNSNP